MDSLSFYPTLTEELLDKCGCVCDKYDFSYLIEGSYRSLRPRGKNTVKLEDSLESWKIENDGLRICRQITIESPSYLYGKNGLLCSEASLGICIIWNNKTLTQMGYIKPESIVNKGESLVCNFKHEFLPGEIKGDLVLDTVLYVQKEAENVHPGEEHLINEAGVTIGTIDSIALDFDSFYMDFPIKEVKDPNMPLWWLELNQWDDPTQDPFNEDYVCLYLNSHYSFCPKVGDTIKNVDILVEIVSTAYLMIIKKIEEMGYLVPTLDGNNLEVGSISQAMYYFYTSCDPALKLESIDLLQKTIRINIERMLKGGQSE